MLITKPVHCSTAHERYIATCRMPVIQITSVVCIRISNKLCAFGYLILQANICGTFQVAKIHLIAIRGTFEGYDLNFEKAPTV